jgi:hypothetical protein
MEGDSREFAYIDQANASFAFRTKPAFSWLCQSWHFDQNCGGEAMTDEAKSGNAQSAGLDRKRVAIALARQDEYDDWSGLTERSQRHYFAMADAAIATGNAGATPDYEAAARALGFTQQPSGKWWTPNPLWHPTYMAHWDTAEEIFETWGGAKPGNAGAVEVYTQEEMDEADKEADEIHKALFAPAALDQVTVEALANDLDKVDHWPSVNLRRRVSELLRALSHPAPTNAGEADDTFLGYRDKCGRKMHCAHTKCPHDDKCKRGCVDAIATTKGE